MKWLTILAVATFLAAAASCKKAEDPLPSTMSYTPATQNPDESEAQTLLLKKKRATVNPKPDQQPSGTD